MEIKETANINSEIYHDAFQIREAVFIKEQHVPAELEQDAFEAKTTHFVGYDSHVPVTTLRILKQADSWKIQRVATQKQARGHGYAKQLLEHIIALAKQDKLAKKLILDGQLTAIPFYEKLGFKIQGETFEEAGILHKHMSLNLN
ncbi:GNAT family N-acetyltransferase [Paucilactobacillus sp. N302-9]